MSGLKRGDDTLNMWFENVRAEVCHQFDKECMSMSGQGFFSPPEMCFLFPGLQDVQFREGLRGAAVLHPEEAVSAEWPPL